MRYSLPTSFRTLCIFTAVLPGTIVMFPTLQTMADGMVKGPAKYEGSLAESSQEAVIIVTNPSEDGLATEDLLLKISVKGEVSQFAWVIPFPNQPVAKKADAQLFKELFNYVEHRLDSQRKSKKKFLGGMGGYGGATGVDVLSREIVGSYDVAVVREHGPGGGGQHSMRVSRCSRRERASKAVRAPRSRPAGGTYYRTAD